MPEGVSKRGPRERLSFETAFSRLEETVQALEAGGLTLTEATRLYEDGVRLGRVCNELLTAAELRITRLQTTLGEQMRFLHGEESPDGAPEQALDGAEDLQAEPSQGEPGAEAP
jgi:exodeoxyribonuclease VII small subunit